MKKGQIVTGIVERVDFPNKGLVRVEEPSEDGQVKTSYCVVKDVIPGQKISLMVKKLRKGKAEGNLKEVLEPAANQVEAPCSHFGQCGGCTYLHLSYEDQAALKEEQVKKLVGFELNENEDVEKIKEQLKLREQEDKKLFSK